MMTIYDAYLIEVLQVLAFGQYLSSLNFEIIGKFALCFVGINLLDSVHVRVH